MRKTTTVTLVPVIIILLMTGCEKKPTEIIWQDSSFNNLLEMRTEQPIMLEFYTDWCNWCKKLEAETFTDSRVIEYVNQNFTSKRINGEVEEGIGIVNEYTLLGYPTLIFISSDGTEIDRITGYRPADAFFEEISRINENKYTISDIRVRLKNDPADVDLWNKLADKYEERQDFKSAAEVWETLAEINPEITELAEYKIVENHSAIEQDPQRLRSFIDSHDGSEYTDQAFRKILSIHRKNENKESEAAVYLEFIEYMEDHGKASSRLYNSYAWRMGQLEIHLENAITMVEKGITLIDAEDIETLAGVMDTKAEVLWKMGRIEEAVAVINECIRLQPEYTYLQEQKTKFLAGS
jgi:thioredoxin-related protein